VRQCHLGPFRSRFAPHHNQWPFIYRHHHVIFLLASCSSDLSILSLTGLTHLTIIVKFKVSKTRSMFEESTYWFVKTQAICLSTVVKAIPSCGGDHLQRHVQELHASTTSLILDFGCIIFILLSLVLSINSPNATPLHSRSIWEGVLRV